MLKDKLQDMSLFIKLLASCKQVVYSSESNSNLYASRNNTIFENYFD